MIARPHCKAPDRAIRLEAETYIVKATCPGREADKKMQTGLLNRRLVILELGEVSTPAVMRCHLEKIGFQSEISILQDT